MVAGSLSPFSLNAHSVSPGVREIGHGNVADTSAPFQYRKILRSWLLFESVDLHAIGYSTPTRGPTFCRLTGILNLWAGGHGQSN
jgi:hypothetical protein